MIGDLKARPHYLIIGAAKCGTRSLFNYLNEHPNISPCLKKEVHFFTENFYKGLDWYLSHFPSLLQNQQGVITGEATPYYLFHPHAAKRVKQTMPDAKFIVLLRNPVDRAYSQYSMLKSYLPHLPHLSSIPSISSLQNLSFEQAIKKELTWLPRESKMMYKYEKYISLVHRLFSFIHRGVYVDQLKVWMKLFPREQFLVIKSEDFFAKPQKIYNQVIEFLGLPPWSLENYKIFNEGHYSEMKAETRKWLIEYFRPHNQRLYEYLGIDFKWDF